MKQKFTIQSESIFYNNETINIVYLDNKTNKYTLYQKETENSDTYDESLFKKFEFDDSFQIAPKKKFSNITFTYFKDDVTNMFQVKYNNKFLYYHIDTLTANFVYDSVMNVLQGDGTLYTRKNTLTKTLNIFDDNASVKENNVENLVENELNYSNEKLSLEESVTVVEENKTVIEEHVINENQDNVIEKLIDVVFELSSDEQNTDTQQDFSNKVEEKEIVIAKEEPVIFEEIVIAKEEPVIVEETIIPNEEPVIVEETITVEESSIKEIVIPKEESIAVEETVIPKEENVVIQQIAETKDVVENNHTNNNKKVSFSDYNENFTFNNIIEDFMILDKILSKKTDVKKVEEKKINYHKTTYNHNNVNYNLNTVKISPIKQNTNLVNQVIEDSNIFSTYDNAMELDNNNNNYIILFNKTKYLINKKENTLTFINLQNKNILSVNNKDYFKLENINYLLTNNGSLIIPVETKKYFDNNNGTSYNVFVPKSLV